MRKNDKNCHSDHLFEYLTLREDNENMCGDTKDCDKVIAVSRNTIDAIVGKLQCIVSVPAALPATARAKSTDLERLQS